MSTNTKRQWVRVTRSEPCEVCGKPDFCTRSACGTISRCMRVESDKPSKAKDGAIGWLHRLTEPLPVVERRETEPAAKVDAAALAEAMYRRRAASAKRSELAERLGVSVAALELLRVGVGWDRHGKCEEFASFPARDSLGRIVGITRRYGDGRKLTVRGTSNAGVFLAPKWWTYPGPVFVVEGPSDVAALLSERLCVIGRPSNTAGGQVIRRLVARRRRGSWVLVVGERDAKPERRGTVSQCPADCPGCAWCWPGLYGAREVAGQLRATWLLPPEGAKDVREWRTQLKDMFVPDLIGRALGMDGPELLDAMKRLQSDLDGMRERVAATEQQIGQLATKQQRIIERLTERFAELRSNGKESKHG